MRADRLIAELMLLQQRGRMTARDLAREVEVTERTVYRDIEALSISGVPVFTDRGPGGGISLVESYRTTLTGLKRDEVRALFMLSIPNYLDEVGMDVEARMAFLKLSAALPGALREEERRVRQRFYIDPSGWQSTREPGAQTAFIQQAIWEDRFIRIRYRSILGERVAPLDAVVEPYGLVARRGEWHLVSQREGIFMVLRLDRILEVIGMPDHYTREPGFDLPRFWENWLEEQSAHPRAYQVEASVIPDVLPYLGEHLDLPDGGQISTSDELYRVQVRLIFEDLEQARSWMMGFGSAVEVQAPLALRLSIADYGREIVSLYSGG